MRPFPGRKAMPRPRPLMLLFLLALLPVTFEGINTFEGGIGLTGKTIPQAKLPFEP